VKRQITHSYALLFLLFALLFSCNKQDSYVYELNDVQVYTSAADKVKPKTEEQYISILYANLFQEALSADQLVNITDLMRSIGDKEVGHEILISNFMNDGSVILPADSVMWQDLDGFIVETYKRFLVREPSEAEKTWFRNFIQNNPQVSPELVFFAFALSNEYLFY
jgi:hypothetical protein